MFVKNGKNKVPFDIFESVLVYTVEDLKEDDTVDLLGWLNWSDTIRYLVYNM